MFCILKNKKVCFAYVSKNNSNREKQVIHLIIPNVEGREICENKVCENKDFCNVIMHFEDTKILESTQYQV